MAEEQHGKIRLILNMLCPKGSSYNDNVDKFALRTVKISSARQFGQSVPCTGPNALMSKMDMKDAYKQVPVKIWDL